MRIPLERRVDLISPENAPKLLHAGEEWQGDDYPHVLVTDDSVRIIGGLDTGVSVDPQFGTTVRGPVSLLETPDKIHIGAYWALNPMLLACIGSSAAMNVPTLVPAKPAALEAKKEFSSLASSLTGPLEGMI